ncbi:LysE family translocator [Ciceribacter sp. L1K23]|uniref:LysE family translocator n=1 Tax=unclassified Ciceribacter TaxID=2628820 RepID=UPI001ABE6704|nr:MULTISPECIES: LysE family translocator [unclassified Ciceribacter]MBO3760601.1 LysE family translocator [Ciceribacter sp. L1K22]MBR0555340.1 LysE family translocator [Ciceribacter sp. L1K23]
MDSHILLAFAAAFFVFAASPGPDNMTIVARTVTSGPLSGIAYGLGTVAGILVYLALAAFGLTVLAAEMGWLMTLLRYGGAIYLIWMGIKLWTEPARVPAENVEARQGDVFKIFLTGFVLNLGNPKMPLFYVALLPNFVGESFGRADFVALATVILGVETLVIGGHVVLAWRARRLLRTPSVVTITNRVAGTLLAGAGIATLALRRGS